MILYGESSVYMENNNNNNYNNYYNIIMGWEKYEEDMICGSMLYKELISMPLLNCRF